MPIVIKKTVEAGGDWYEIEDFNSYVEELRRRGIEPPSAKYRIYVSHATEDGIRHSVADFDSQLGLFFRLGSSAGVDFVVRA